MCDCRTMVEGKLTKMFAEQKPEAADHKVSLQGYALIFGDELTEKGCMEAVMTAIFPLKKGGTKEKKLKQKMMFTYCPFCGEAYGSA